MSKQTRVSHPIYNLLPTEIEGSIPWQNLPWICAGRGIMPPTKCGASLIPDLWEITHNPWVVLQTVSRDQIERVLANPVFRKSVDGLVQTTRQAAKAPAWFQTESFGRSS